MYACGHGCRRYAELEQQLGETERARQLFEVGVEQPILDLPEALWKAYIDFEISEANTANVRSLYNRLLDRTTHPKVFVSFAQFEASSGDVESARAVYARGDAQFKGNASAKEERLLVLEAWLLFEQQHGDTASAAVVEAKMPKQVWVLCLLHGVPARPSNAHVIAFAAEKEAAYYWGGRDGRWVGRVRWRAAAR